GIRDKLVTGVQTCALPISILIILRGRFFKPSLGFLVIPAYAPPVLVVYREQILCLPLTLRSRLLKPRFGFNVIPLNTRTFHVEGSKAILCILIILRGRFFEPCLGFSII